MIKRLWREDEGVLTFEWILLLTVLVIGIVGGLAGVRDAVIHELQGVAGAMVSLDQSYVIQAPLGIAVGSLSGTDDSGTCTSGAAGSAFTDNANIQTGRTTPPQQVVVPDSGNLCPIVAPTTPGQ